MCLSLEVFGYVFGQVDEMVGVVLFVVVLVGYFDEVVVDVGQC